MNKASKRESAADLLVAAALFSDVAFVTSTVDGGVVIVFDGVILAVMS